MNIEDFREYCLSLPGTTEGMKWDHLCFMIEDKIFVIVDLEDNNRFATKCSPEEFDELTSREGIAQAYHLAKRQWVQVAHLEVLNDAELKNRIAASRALVLAKLPKKIQQKYL
ncbi:YjbR [compost metagenome]